MRTRISITAAVLFVPVLCAAEQAPLDAAAQLKQAEAAYKNKDYETAERLYQDVVLEAPGSEEAFAAQKRLCCVYAAGEKEPESVAAVQKMLVDFAAHGRLPHAVHEVAEECHRVGKGGQIKGVYQGILSAQPGHEQGIWLKMGEAISSVFAGDDEQADAAVEELVNTYRTDERCAEGVAQVAWSYRKLERHAEARELYRLVMGNWPGGPRVIYAQRDLVRTCIALGDDPNAAAGTEKLIRDFAPDERLPNVLANIAGSYRDARKPKEARNLYRHILENHRASSEAIWSQRGVILTSMELNDDPNAMAGIEKLLAEYSGHKDISRVVYQVARRLGGRNDPNARGLFEYAREKGSGSEYEALARVNLASLEVRAEDNKQANDIYDRVLADFAGKPVLTRVVSLMAEAYWNQAAWNKNQGREEAFRAYVGKALTTWNKVVEELPEQSFETSEAVYFSGRCYEILGDTPRALDRYKTMVEKWPDQGHAWNAQFLIARCYERLGRSGEIPMAEAVAGLRQACEKVLTNYPDCLAVGAARGTLERWENYKAE